MTNRIFKFFLASAFTCLVLSAARSGFSESLEHIVRLKDFNIETILVDGDRPSTIIVSPKEPAYDAAITLLQNRIRSLAGVELKVVDASVESEMLLEETHVIALGNMTVNPLIQSLYTKWYTFLDLKYPGKGGHVVRSLHNPLGTGKNVILVGGSDAAGVEKAAEILAQKLMASNPLKLGWIMEVSLGESFQPPFFSANSDAHPIYSWRDSWRGEWNIPNGKRKGSGYNPSTFFGWNPISIAGILYYMTGRSDYLKTFKSLAIPASHALSERLLTDEAFEDPKDPLVKSYHYRAHLLDLVWDLIEESPHFSDTERLTITNKLLDHQIHLDKEHDYSKTNSSRHGAYHMLCIYTGSRYFSKYYPDPIWNQRLENVLMGYNSFIGNPTWGERDTLMWVPTSIEPALEFFLLDGAENFLKSGAAKEMIGALDILFSGKIHDEYNKFSSISLFHKASFLLKDTRYAWMAQQLGFDFNRFRIGQSYWPAGGIPDAPPADMIGAVKAYQVAKTDWEKSGKSVPQEKSFQIASYRSGTGPNDDYLLMDGFAGLGRNRYHLSAIKELRMFGQSVLSGYENDVDILKDGLSKPEVPRAAELKKTFSTDGFAYLHAEVPDMPGAMWNRHVMLVKDQFSLVVDGIRALADAPFDIDIGWRFGAKIDRLDSVNQSIVIINGIRAQTSWAPFEVLGDFVASQVSHRRMQKNESTTAFTLLAPTKSMTTIAQISPSSSILRGMKKGYVCVGAQKNDHFEIDAGFAYVGAKRILLVDATAFRIDSHTVFASGSPCLVFWDLASGDVRFACRAAARVTLGASPARHFDLNAGESRYSGIMPPEGRIKSFLTEVEGLPLADAAVKIAPHEVFPRSQWTKAWQKPAPGMVTAIERCPQSPAAVAYVARGSRKRSSVVSITADGGTHSNVGVDTEVLTLRPAANQKQAEHFAFLIGCQDDTLQAYDDRGNLQWAVTTQPDPSFRVGERFNAPWFTDPNPPYSKQGVRAIAVGDIWNAGKARIVAGRPSTIAAYSLDGHLIGSSPVHWGGVSAMGVIDQTDDPGRKLLLVAKDPAGMPSLTAIDEKFTNISDAYMKNTLPEYTDMHAWLQRGAPHMLAVDLDGNGSQEVVYTLSGHWNEIRAYDAATQKVLWMHYFGPAESNSPFMRGLALTDLDGDGKHEVATATQDGWLLVFGHDGVVTMRKKFSAGVTALAADDSGRHLSIGLDDGRVLLCGPDFSLVDQTDLPPTALRWSGEDLYAGGAGYVTKYSVK